jgi:penicillin-binding protein 1A
MTVRLADKVGMDAIANTAQNFGIYNNMQKNLASSLGSNETTLMQMVTAYGMIVNGGKKIEPSFVDRIQNRYGETIYKRDTRQCATCGPKIRWADGMSVPEIKDPRAAVTDPRRAYQIVSILEGAVQRGTGVRLKNIGFPLAGKTGTTNDSKDAWFIGFTPDLVFGAYVGFDKPRTLGRKETGASTALPIIKQFLESAREEDLIDATPFRVPSGVSLMQVNAKTGRRAYPGENNVIWEAFMSGESPDAQQTIYGGETVIFDEPNINQIDYMNLFDQIPTATGGIMTQQFDEFGNPIAPVIPRDEFNTQNNPTLQGTGGIY